MALSRTAKEAAVDDLQGLLGTAKMSVVAQYSGLTVNNLQDLRSQASQNGTTVRVAKNRLVRIALEQIEHLKDVPTDELQGQVLYAFNSEDEVAPAQVLHEFAKQHPALTFVGAISADGNFLQADQVKRLAELPSKDQLRGQLVSVIAAPMSGFVNVLAGNIRGLGYVLQARAAQLGE